MKIKSEGKPTMTIRDEIEALSGDPAGLEHLYRRLQAEGNEDEFREALRQVEEDHPDHILFDAWARRLDLPVESDVEHDGRSRRWWTIIAGSVILGIVSALLAQGKAPVPVPGEGARLFWVGWAPLVALGILGYLSRIGGSTKELTRYAAAGVAVLVVAVYVRLTIGDGAGDVAVLAAMHVPFLSWAVVGTAIGSGYPNPARQSFAYLVKSVEVVLTGGIFFGAGLIFVGLTYGIFAVLGIELPEEDLQIVAAWAVGAIPLLALGSVYDPEKSPAAQDWHAGLTRTLQILARLLLPLALGVLLVYVIWFIPVYFRKPFEEREVLIVYNATILAIMVLMTVVVSGPVEVRTHRQRALFRYAVYGLGVLTLILNVYALAAVASRTIESGLTPNRFAVIGWNVTTLLIMAAVAIRIRSARREVWLTVFRESIGRLAPIAAIWAALLLIALPFFH